ncbi:hypothetical protein MMC08_008320 [Hypocenomyce scalaris]|nr:hypothetical protein [Hypocenomyce scalaris]
MPAAGQVCVTEGGISRQVLTVLGMMNIVEGFTMNVIWPFLPFMVEAFGVATEDTVGLRPTLLAGTLGTCVANLVFGFAPTYKVAIFGRVLSGLLNSNAGISKTYLGESCTKQQQPAAFATFCVMYGLGSVIAPAIGGFLRYSKLGKNYGLIHPSLMHMRMAMLVHAIHNP